MFIALEGLDGAGKSTQIKLLENYFENKNKRNKYLHFPRFDTPFFGEMIAKFLRGDFGKINDVNPYIVALLFAHDRRDASQTIYNWLNQNHNVIVDRYVYSNIGYQCAKIADKDERNALRNWILALEYDYFKIPKPDISIFLDVPFAFTEDRLNEARNGNDRDYLNGKQDIHEENLELQRRVREIYIEQKDTDANFKVINCTFENGNMLAPQQIFEQIIKILPNI
ncbi:MAG: dTMP kinase [Prevotellaceae bacterium]|jgi:dTMP kinase|nr:dTMP kinase [Prevotellaceae bacterium]